MGTRGFLPGARFPGDVSELSTKQRKSSEGSYDQDDDQILLDDDVNSTMSESSSGMGGLEQLLPCKMTERQTSRRKAAALHGHESDVDSGIVSCQLMDNHTASISSSETDSSPESASNEQKSRLASDSTQCVRFDEQLHLSEENIRRSCRKLFATLYSHRFSYPCYNDSEILSKASVVHRASLSQENGKTGESRVQHIGKLKTHSRLDTAKIDNALSKYESQRHRYRINQSTENASACSNREQDFYIYKNTQKIKPEYRRSESSSVVYSSIPMLISDVKQRDSDKHESTPYSTKGKQLNDVKISERNLCGTHSASSITEQSRHGGLSVDQRLAPAFPDWLESQKFNSFRPPLPSLHQQNCYSSLANNTSERNKSPMHKSLSCTVLSTSGNSSLSLRPYDRRSPTLPRRTSDPISISSLNISDFCRNQALERTSHNIPQVTTRSSMVRAYARYVPIISDDLNSNAGAKLTQKPSDITANARNGVVNKRDVSYPVSSNTLSKHSNGTKKISTTTQGTSAQNGLGPRGKLITGEDSSSNMDLNHSTRSQELLKGINTLQKRTFYAGGRKDGVSYSQPNVSEMSNHKYAAHKVSSHESIQAPNRENVSPYKTMTLNHFKYNGNRKFSKKEYETLDQSRKSRFNSLPVLDTLISVDTKDGNLPMNSKRGLHQSDFTLYRNRLSASSSGKSVLDRIQGFTRSAKNAVQRAFSTERIYRPEREERYEAEGQKLKSSHSFIRGLRERMSKKKRTEKKKKKKMRPTAAQVVTQERLNTSWDEPILGPGSVTHVEGQLLQLNPDGSQVIELTKPPSKPYGFFVARGRIRNSRGVFVSRMRDHDTEEHLTGLLGIGDEILEIEGLNVKHADILEVNSLMAQRNSLILTVLPYVCRKD